MENDCSVEVPCSFGSNGEICSNGGEATGTIVGNNCGCLCTSGFEGANCLTKIPCTLSDL